MVESVETFVELVRGYLELIDRAAESRPYDLLASCAQLLPRIYAAGLELSESEVSEVAGASGEFPSPVSTLTQMLGRYDRYFEVFDPVSEQRVVTSSLADDLADIYRDLAGPLADYDEGRSSDAIWRWRLNIRGHCGDHIVDALRAIHRLVNDHMPPDYKAGQSDG